MPAATWRVDASRLRLGDRMALAWWAQRRRLDEGLRFAVIDRAAGGGAPVFDLPLHFPLSFEPDEGRPLPDWDTGNLWLTVTNAFARQPQAGQFEHVPPAVLSQAQQLRAGRSSAGPRVLMHVLDDAPYNKARNWQRTQALALAARLQQAGCEVVLLNPSPGQFLGGLDRMLAEMLACDAFIGGDTGPSHVFAMLCADKPQLALYPDMARDQRKFAAEQQALGLPLPWNSLPKRPDLAVLTLRAGRQWVRQGWRWRYERVGRFDAAEAADRLLQRLAVPGAAA